MATPQELCFEDLDLAPTDDRYVRCVALPGAEPGLALDHAGAVRWLTAAPGTHALFVSADDRLALLAGDGAPPITVSRAGRELTAPAGKPVFLRDQDLLAVGTRRLRLHVHGATAVVAAPEPLRGAALAGLLRAAAVALALGSAAAAGAGGGPAAPIEVRDAPPKVRHVRTVVCAVTSVAPSKKGPLLVYATCEEPGVEVGGRGQLLDDKGKAITDGTVVVTSVDGKKIVGETPLKAPVKAKQVRFRLP